MNDPMLSAYEALWNEPDPVRRTALIEHCLVETAEIIGPGYRLRGHAAIFDDVSRFHREQPGRKAVIASGVDAHSGWARFAFRIVAADGAVLAEGLDAIEFAADGRINRVITFFGALPAAKGARATVMPGSARLDFETFDAVPADLARVVDDGLGEANERAAPSIKDVRRLACFARAGGSVIGGAIGRTWGGCCELQQLWVDAAHRKGGVGTRLVRRFEERAITRGCRTFYLDTFTFQAPAFYRKLGYETALEVDGFAPGVVRYTMMRRLDGVEPRQERG